MTWRPQLTVYRAANRRVVRVMLNRYRIATIGVAVQVGQTVISLTWIQLDAR